MARRAIEVENLEFVYPDATVALRGISFCVEEGESVGVIGPNGSGKTTLLLHLNGILLGRGRVSIFGCDVAKRTLSFIRRQVGMVFEDPEIQLFMPTVAEDVAFGPVQMGLGADDVRRRVRDALSSVDMAGVESRISHHLSFGEKKRVCVATVLAMDPKILVLDEPTGNLDPRHRCQLISILRSLPATKIIASCDLDTLGRLTQRLLFLEEGRIIASAPTQEALSDAGLLKRIGFFP